MTLIFLHGLGLKVLHTVRGFKVQMYDHDLYQGDKTRGIVQEHRQKTNDHSFRKR